MSGRGLNYTYLGNCNKKFIHVVSTRNDRDGQTEISDGHIAEEIAIFHFGMCIALWKLLKQD